MMTINELKQKKIVPPHSVLVMGESGTGKTTFGATYPRAYFLFTEPGGYHTFLNRPDLHKNIYGWDEIIPESVEDTKRVLSDIRSACLNARKLFSEGKIETFVFDNITYYADFEWMYINKYMPSYSGRNGELDTRGMYGDLAARLSEFIWTSIVPFRGNLVVTSHIKLEDEETMKKRAINKQITLTPNLLGGLRSKVSGYFSCYIMLERERDIATGKMKYRARTIQGGGAGAKSRITLPDVIDNICYDTLHKSIANSIEIGG